MKNDGTKRAKRKLILSHETVLRLTSNETASFHGLMPTTPDCEPPPTTEVAPSPK